jgi:dihydrofolate reductase
MPISLVVAVSENGVIGRDGGLPWHLPADLKHFRAITMGRSILMGRKTHASIGRPLPGRRNLILSHDHTYRAEGCLVVNSMEAALQTVSPEEELMVVGGEALYRLTLPLAQRIYLTRVHAVIEGSVRFPALQVSDWKESRREDYRANARNPYDYSFIWLERCSAGGRQEASLNT